MPIARIQDFHYPSGRLESRTYFLDNICHRDPADGPARIWFNTDGTIRNKAFWVNNMLLNDIEQDLPELKPKPDSLAWFDYFN
jgi:hypothetical protein